MNADLSQLSATARRAVQARDWATVSTCARRITKQNRKSPEGYFLSGLVEKAAKRANKAIAAFSRAISLDAGRYDAAIELAHQYVLAMRHGEALALLQRYESRLVNSPLYLDMAAGTYTMLGLHASAWPLYQKANELQPGLEQFQARLAACAVYLGKIKEAKAIYCKLLEQRPNHQKNHYELSRLETAQDTLHLEQMLEVLGTTRLPPEKNIFLYYAIGKELEDLERWQEAFRYYKMAGDAVSRVTRKANYDVGIEVKLINKIIEVCNSDWLATTASNAHTGKGQKTPVFIVGLPRTGTTLTERILASHSQLESADETFFLEYVIRRSSGNTGSDSMSPAIIEAAAKKDIRLITRGYMNAVGYRLGDRRMFIDKYPLNFLYLGFIAKAWPDAHIIHLLRNPMDACFALYKQSFFKFAYTLESLGSYYVAYDRLRRHWGETLGGRIIEVKYESLVADPENQTRVLLDRLGLDFEPACLNFHLNKTPSATASSVQIREKTHSRSVNKWKKFEKQLRPLKDYLDEAGISTDGLAS